MPPRARVAPGFMRSVTRYDNVVQGGYTRIPADLQSSSGRGLRKPVSAAARSCRNRIVRGDGEAAGGEPQRVPAAAADVTRPGNSKSAAQRRQQYGDDIAV